MDKETQDKVIKKLDEHIKKCPICKKGKWFLNQRIFELFSFRNIGGPVNPVVIIVCENCGYQLHFNAIMLGIVEKDEPEKKKKHWWSKK